MNKSLRIIFFLFSCNYFAFAQSSVYNQFVDTEIPQWPVIVNPGEYVANELLLMLQPGTDIGIVYDDFLQFGDTISKIFCCGKSMRVYKLDFSGRKNISKELTLAKTFPEIKIAQYNHYVADRSTTPNDVQFGTMWNLNNTGQSGGTFDADIDAPEAWDITTGRMTIQGDTIVVAVIDAGFDLAHEDLNFKKNYAEIPNNNIDDDGNGYVDDFDGWNAYNSTGTITSDFHGTHVSGIIGARGNNTFGIAGINWGVKILPVMGSDGTEAQVVEAYTYVYDMRKLYNQTNGAQGEFIVSTNSSFGVDQGQPANYPLWCAMYDSLGTVGILSAGATANQNWDIDVVGDIPTACASNFLISVTNTDRNDLKFSSAAFGDTTIDIGAPGTQINSTMPGNTYGAMTGTSMACPHVAGAIALMYAAACTQMIMDYKNHPDSVALVVKNYLLTSADPNASLNGITVSNGRLNLFNSLLAVATYYCSTQEIGTNKNELNVLNIFPNPANGNVTILCNAHEQVEAKIIFTNVLGEEMFSVDKNLNAGNNFLYCDVSSFSAGIYFVQTECDGKISAAKRLVIQ